MIYTYYNYLLYNHWLANYRDENDGVIDWCFMVPRSCFTFLQTSSTQTDTQWSDVMLSVPKTLFNPLLIPTDRSIPSSPTDTAVEYMVQNSLTTDCARLQLCRLPGNENGGKKPWRSYMFMVGMVVVDQALKIGTNAIYP